MENSIKYEEDIRITPFWSAFFCTFYIVGTARRIRDRLKSIGSSEWETGPWWAFVLFLLQLPLNRYKATDNIVINIAFLLLYFIATAIVSWQITRLQMKANNSMIFSKELEYINKARFNRWDIIFLIYGLVLIPFFVIGSIFPLD